MKIKTTGSLILAGILLSAFAQLANAQNQSLSSTLEVWLISVNEDGEEMAEQVTEVEPGEILEYRLTYTNNLPETISSLQAVLPIPIEVQYLAQTAAPEIDAASLSATGAFQSLPVMREVTLPGGEVAEREVPPAEYRRLHWIIQTLGAQQSITLYARVKVIDLPTQ